MGITENQIQISLKQNNNNNKKKDRGGIHKGIWGEMIGYHYILIVVDVT